jgi:hypothetical protein
MSWGRPTCGRGTETSWPSRLSFLARSDADIQSWKDLRILVQSSPFDVLLICRRSS